MSRYSEVKEHINERPIIQKEGQQQIIENLQDINETLALLYDLEVHAINTGQEPPAWLAKWMEEH